MLATGNCTGQADQDTIQRTKEGTDVAAQPLPPHSYSLDLRVGEANTISDSGKVGVSDTFAAALWSLDSSFEAAAAGAIGMNFHQGNGGSIYAAVLRPTGPDGKLQPPIVRPQWYGFLMFQMAANRGSRFVGKQVGAS